MDSAESYIGSLLSDTPDLFDVPYGIEYHVDRQLSDEVFNSIKNTLLQENFLVSSRWDEKETTHALYIERVHGILDEKSVEQVNYQLQKLISYHTFQLKCILWKSFYDDQNPGKSDGDDYDGNALIIQPDDFLGGGTGATVEKEYVTAV